MYKNIALVVYTNYEYHDVMNLFVKYFHQYFSFNIKKYVLTDKNYNSDYININYDNNKSYCERLLDSLYKIEEENIIFLHEDMILYDFIEHENFQNLINIFIEDNIDYIKLIKTGNEELIEYKKNLYKFNIHSQTAFAIQPTIWKKNTFINLLKTFGKKTIWDLEKDVQQYCINNFFGLYYHDINSKKRGEAHWDSKIFPYIATAIVKGKWNIKEYKKELIKIQEETELNFFIRGVFI